MNFPLQWIMRNEWTINIFIHLYKYSPQALEFQGKVFYVESLTTAPPKILTNLRIVLKWHVYGWGWCAGERDSLYISAIEENNFIRVQQQQQ